MISNKIKELRSKFNIYNIDGYVVPKNDSYFNEYSSPDRLKFISNFDGSAGLAIILRKKNYLFVDGRYTIQAKSQSGKNFDVVEIHKKLPWKVLKHSIKIGYNPYCFTSLGLARYFKNYFKLVPIYDDLISKKKSRKINILNSSRFINKKSINNLQVHLNRSRYIINYNLSSDKINFNSDNSFIGNNKLIYSGNIFFDPFNFDIKSSLDSLKLKKLFLNSSLLKEILSNDFILNENFNGKINLNVKKLENNPFFDNLKMNINFKGRTLEFNNSTFLNDKIANLIVKKAILYEEKNNIIIKSNVDFVIKDLNKFFNKFVVPKKNRHDFKKISFEILTNLTTNDLKILNITNESFKNKEFPEIDELIYEFNSGSVKVSNWIEFKIFANKIISYYAG